MLTVLRKALPLGALAAIAGVLFSFSPSAHELEEDNGLGLLFKLRGRRQPPGQAVVISIDKDSANQLDISENPEKWPRSLHARLVEVLSKAGAAVITFDVHFLEPRIEKDDKSFAAALQKSGKVVLSDPMTATEVAVSPGTDYGAEHSIVKIVKPLPLLGDAALATAPFVLPRIPFKVNQYWTFQSEGALSPPPTFPVVAYQIFAGPVYQDFVRLLEKVRLNVSGKLPQTLDRALKDKSVGELIRSIKDFFDSDPALAQAMSDELERSSSAPEQSARKSLLATLIHLYGGSNRRYLNYYGPPRTVTTIPYYRALQLADTGANLNPVDIKGKAVFVGLSERILAERKDSFYTVFSQANGVFIGGVEIAATAFLNRLEDMPIRPISSRSFILTILLWGMALGVICRMTSIWLAAASVIGLSVLYLFTAEYQFKASGTWFPIIVPLFVQS